MAEAYRDRPIIAWVIPEERFRRLEYEGQLDDDERHYWYASRGEFYAEDQLAGWSRNQSTKIKLTPFERYPMTTTRAMMTIELTVPSIGDINQAVRLIRANDADRPIVYLSRAMAADVLENASLLRDCPRKPGVIGTWGGADFVVVSDLGGDVRITGMVPINYIKVSTA